MRRASATAARHGAPRLAGVLALAAALALLSGCTLSGAEVAPPRATPGELAEQVAQAGTEPTATPGADVAATALDVLASLPVAPRTEWDGYFDRAGSFGEGWTDPDGNGCDARNDALRSALTDVSLLHDGCRVASGSFVDPYTGETAWFERGPESSDDVQIDHVVALYNAWRTGAQQLTFEQRVALSNDPLNLQPTLDWVNDDKQSSDASQWLPPNAAYHCTYVARQIAVKATYGLWVTRAEHDAMRDVLDDCAA